MIKSKNLLKPSLMVILAIIASICLYNILKLNSNKAELPSVNPSFGAFHDISSLVKASDIIIVGSVDKVYEPIKVNKRNYMNENAKAKLPDVFIVNTVSEVKVHKALKGDLKAGDTIEVMQESGSGKNNEMDIPDVKIYAAGDNYIFFLRDFKPSTAQEFKDYKTEKFLPISPYQGQIKIQNGKAILDKNIIPEFKNINSSEKIQSLLINQINN